MKKKALSSRPSSLYRMEIWQFGLWLVRALPPSICGLMGRLVAMAYWAIVKHRRKIVIQNVSPACAAEPARARRTARFLFNSANTSKDLLNTQQYF